MTCLILEDLVICGNCKLMTIIGLKKGTRTGTLSVVLMSKDFSSTKVNYIISFIKTNRTMPQGPRFAGVGIVHF